MASKLDIRNYSIPAGGAAIVEGRATFFGILAASSPVDVTFKAKHSRTGEARGVEAGFTAGPFLEAFGQIEIRSSDGSAQTVQVALSDMPVNVPKVAGSVTLLGQPIDAMPGERTTAGNRFYMGYRLGNGSGTVWSAIQLRNPPGSGKKLVVRRAVAGINDGVTTSYGTISFGYHNAAFLNVTSEWNKLAKASPPASVASVEYQQSTFPSIFGATVGPWLQTYQPFETIGADPVVLEEGYSWAVRNDSADKGLYVHFEWEEV